MYSAILIDVFSLYYKKQASSLSKESIDLANDIISFIEKDIIRFLNKDDGKLYLLFDPIPKTDLGVSACFKTTRQKIVKSYKSNREHNKKTIIIVDLIKRYFLHKNLNNNTYIVISNNLEADDFVNGIIRMQPENASIAMITTDEDWCRYLNKNVVIINKGFEEPYTQEVFEKKYNFKPNSATVTLFKSIFGDASDNVPSIFTHKKIPGINQLKKEIFNWIQWLGQNNEEFNVVYDRIKNYSFLSLERKSDLNIEEQLFLQLISFSIKKDVLTQLWNNIEVIKCQCSDVKKYIIKADDKKNSLLLKLLNRADSEPKKFKFGNIKADSTV